MLFRYFSKTWSNPYPSRDGDRWDRLGDRAGERAELWLTGLAEAAQATEVTSVVAGEM